MANKKLEKLQKKIVDLMSVFKDESTDDVEGNKAAGRRARKISNELGKALKEYRAESNAAGKE